MQGWGVRVSHEASRAGFGNSGSSLEGLSRFPGGEEHRDFSLSPLFSWSAGAESWAGWLLPAGGPVVGGGPAMQGWGPGSV